MHAFAVFALAFVISAIGAVYISSFVALESQIPLRPGALADCPHL